VKPKKNHQNIWKEILQDNKLLNEEQLTRVSEESKKTGEPAGIKVKGRLLADAFKKAGLRKFLPSRVDRHKQADAAEALIVYAWVWGSMTMEEGLEILEHNEDSVEAFSCLLRTAKMKLDTSKLR